MIVVVPRELLVFANTTALASTKSRPRVGILHPGIPVDYSTISCYLPDFKILEHIAFKLLRFSGRQFLSHSDIFPGDIFPGDIFPALEFNFPFTSCALELLP